MGSNNDGLPNPPLEHVYTDSPWQQRVDLDLERQHLAAKCQSFSSLISPWAISANQSDLDSPSPNQIHAFRSPPPLKSPSSMTSGSSVDSCPEDDQDSPFLKEFQLAAKQLEDLALTAADESKSIASDEYITDQPIVSVETIFVGWTECPRAELREDPQKALEASINEIQNGLSDSVGSWSSSNEAQLLIIPNELKVEFKQLSKSIPKKDIRIWGIIHDKFGVIFKTNNKYECHVFKCDDNSEMQNFCEILNDISKVDLRKCSSISSLVDPIARSQDFSIECFYCGNQVIGPEYRADIRQVHKIISEFQNTDYFDSYCTISSTSMSILPRPGSLYPPTPKSSSSSGSEGSSKPFMKCRLRYISFFAVGIDSRYLGIVSVLGPQSICHVIKVLPNASRLSDVLQEQIILRYQKAVEAKKILERQEMKNNDKPMMSSIINMLPSTKAPCDKDQSQITPPRQMAGSGRWKSLLSLIKK